MFASHFHTKLRWDFSYPLMAMFNASMRLPSWTVLFRHRLIEAASISLAVDILKGTQAFSHGLSQKDLERITTGGYSTAIPNFPIAWEVKNSAKAHELPGTTCYTCISSLEYSPLTLQSDAVRCCMHLQIYIIISYAAKIRKTHSCGGKTT